MATQQASMIMAQDVCFHGRSSHHRNGIVGHGSISDGQLNNGFGT